MYIESF